MNMSILTVLPIWQAVQGRFQTMVKALPEQNLSLQIGSASIGSLIRHNAEVEYMFADWFFGRKIPEEMKEAMAQGAEGDKTSLTSVTELVDLLTASNAHLTEAMRDLPEEAWHQSVESTLGASTPLEAIGRLMYHTGIHAGQISLIQKNAGSQ